MMETAQSFSARRSATSSLPTFQLPRPSHLDQRQYPAYAPSSTTGGPTPALASSILTPPAGLQQDVSSPMASSVNSGSSISSNASGPPYGGNVGFWPTPQSSYTYSSAPPMPPAYAGQQPGGYIQGRPMYSPSLYPPNRNTGSPTAGEGLPAPPYDLPPFPGSMPMSSSGNGQPQSHQNLAPQQQQQQAQAQQQAQQQQQQQEQAQQHQQNQQQHQQQLNNPSQQTSQAPPPPGPLHAPDNYGGRPPHAPYYATPASTPQQNSFPAYAQQSPTQQSPQTSSAPSNRISPVSAQHPHQQQSGHPPMAAPGGYRPPPYGPGGYNLPAMAGPIMSNMHQPGGQMSLVGGVNMQYPTHQMSGPLYGHHPGQQQAQNDRPFKCDQCPQSFNRNHDLKRHRRIHLAVKPFPCGHCEKSFSRKDALKRHILVKGCGSSKSGAANTSQSPIEKNEVMSDSTEDNSPEMTKKEIS